MNLPEILIYLVMAISMVSLAYGSFTDVRRRIVKSYLFIPLIIAGFFLNYYTGAPSLFLAAGVVMFALSFLAPDTYAYEIVAFGLFILSIVSMELIGIHWGFQLFVMSIIFFMGFQERLFGIGDIKAIIALMFANTVYSPIIGYIFSNPYYYSVMPTSIALLVNISIFAIVFLVYAVYLASKHGTVDIRGQPLAIRFDDSLLRKNPSAYSKKERNGTSFLVYRIPFIVPVFLGYVLFLVTGFWPLAV